MLELIQKYLVQRLKRLIESNSICNKDGIDENYEESKYTF